MPERDDDSRRIVRIAREWAVEQKLPHVYDSLGICHVVLPQKGHLKPGMFCVGGDSHSPTGGALGTYMFGVGSTEMLGVVAAGGEMSAIVKLTIFVTDKVAYRDNLERVGPSGGQSCGQGRHGK